MKVSTVCSIWVAAGLLLLGSKGFAWAQSVQGASFTVPNGFENVEGNSWDAYPFDGFHGGMRFQQVFDASQFSSISNGGTILIIVFRLEGGAANSGQMISNLQVNLSTTAKGPDSLSPVFAENVGADNTIVFGPGRRRLEGAAGPGEPETFSASIGFATPFFYNPKAGNLLLDIRNYSGPNDDGSLFILDGHTATNDSVSSIFAFNVFAATASRVSSFGFVTYFGTFPLPEVAIFQQSSNILIRWAQFAGNYSLEQSPALGAGANWQPAHGTTRTNGLYKEVTLPLDLQARARFFRLTLPQSSAGVAGSQTAPGATPISTEKH